MLRKELESSLNFMTEARRYDTDADVADVVFRDVEARMIASLDLYEPAGAAAADALARILGGEPQASVQEQVLQAPTPEAAQ